MSIFIMAAVLIGGVFLGGIVIWYTGRAGGPPGPLARRLGPFLDLLDARYLPLLCAVAPQSWTVYAWVLAGGAPAWVAVMGGVGYEAIYVGAIAWAERGAGWRAARLPAVTALVFSVAVAVAHYGPSQGPLAVLHAGFPLVAYAYTVMMHAPVDQERPGLWTTLVRRWLMVDQGQPAPVHADVVQPTDHQLPGPPADQLDHEETVTVAGRTISLNRLAKLTGVSKTTLARRIDQADQEGA